MNPPDTVKATGFMPSLNAVQIVRFVHTLSAVQTVGFLRRILVCLAVASAACTANAAGPELTRSQFVRNVIANHFVPRVAAFALVAPKLVNAMESLCSEPTTESLERARTAWSETMLSWESASAITFGPLASRRSVFRIDFWPSRSSMFEKALSSPPKTLKELESIGGPAKGIPAIEWFLWTPPERPDLMADRVRCEYATLLARDVAEEARLLDAQYVAFAAAGLPDAVANAAFGGLLNLALQGMEQLGVRKMEKPGERGQGKTFPRLLSEQTAAAWNAQWLSIRNFLIGDGKDASDSLDALLRAEGFNDASDHMRAAADLVTKTLESTKATPADAIKAAKDIVVLRKVMVDEVAQALKIGVQFGENDGD